MEDKIPTAKEFFANAAKKLNSDFNDIPTWMLEETKKFVELHVKAALKAAAENIPSEISIDEKTFDKMGVLYLSEESEKEIKKAIIKAYPSTKIK